MNDDINPKYMFQTTDTSLLMAIVKGEIDAKELAEQEMKNRGLDPNTGMWVGFSK